MSKSFCDNGCLSPTTDTCVQYTGPDIDTIGIKGDMYYDELTVNLANALVEHIEKKVELECLYDNTCGNCEPFVTIPVAVQSIIRKLCALTAEDVAYTGALYCIGDGSMSSEAVKLLNRTFNYSVGVNPVGSSLSYNLIEGTSNLPEGYALGTTRVTISGKKKGGKTLISAPNGQVSSVPIENDRYPVNMQVDVDVNTPTGTVRMNKNVNIPSPAAASYTTFFDIKDFTSPDTSNLKLGKAVEMIAAQVCANTSYIDQLKNLQLPKSDNFNSGGSGIESALGALFAAVTGLASELEALKESNENSCPGGNC
jgi:hypothetical protein